MKRAENSWFKLFYWQKSFWRRWYSKLLSILANVQIFNWVSGVGCGNYIYSSKSKGLSDENVTALNTSDYKINLNTFGSKTKV